VCQGSKESKEKGAELGLQCIVRDLLQESSVTNQAATMSGRTKVKLARDEVPHAQESHLDVDSLALPAVAYNGIVDAQVRWITASRSNEDDSHNAPCEL
jgi:hypothetical protein